MGRSTSLSRGSSTSPRLAGSRSGCDGVQPISLSVPQNCDYFNMNLCDAPFLQTCEKMYLFIVPVQPLFVQIWSIYKFHIAEHQSSRMVKRASRSSKRKAAAAAEEVEEAPEGMEVEEEQAAKEVEQEPEEEEASMERDDPAEEENIHIAAVTTAAAEVSIERADSIAASDDEDQAVTQDEEPPVKKPKVVLIFLPWRRRKYINASRCRQWLRRLCAKLRRPRPRQLLMP